MPARMKTNGNFSDAIVEWLHSVSINRAMIDIVDLESQL